MNASRNLFSDAAIGICVEFFKYVIRCYYNLAVTDGRITFTITYASCISFQPSLLSSFLKR